MFQKKIQENLQNISTKLKNFNEVYINYILCITFLNVIILKLNQILFQISSIYLYPTIIFISILFINQWSIITNKVKNTYVFNWCLYYFLIFKNNIYGLTFEYFNYVEHEKYQKLIVFLTGFILSSWTLNIIFLILNNSYNVSILLFIFLLIINIFNLIESKLIFTVENLNQKDQQIDYKIVKKFLKINNLTFDKNRSLFYMQKRYVHFNEIRNLIKKHGITVITSATAGSLFTGYLQISSVQVQKEQLEIQKEQFNFQKELEIRKLEYERIKLEQEIIKQREERLLNYDDKIGILNKKIHKIQVDMDSRNFWNKVDFSGTIAELKEEQITLKNRRLELEKEEITSKKRRLELEEIKTNQNEENLKNIISDKKMKIDNNLLED
jgi:hypothetical protein